MLFRRPDDRSLRDPVCLVLLAAAVLVFCCVEMQWGRVKPLWYDETFTALTVSQPTLKRMLLAAPAAGQPPLGFLLTRGSVALLGATDFALRLPEMLGVVLAMIAAYAFVGRRFGASSGLLAATAVMTSSIADFAMEARPYGLLAGFLMLTLLCWQRAAEPGRRRGVLIGLALSLFAVLLCHPLGKVYALAILVGEAVRTLRNRRVDGGMIAALVAGLSALAIALPVDLAIRHMLTSHVGKATPRIAEPFARQLAQIVYAAINTPVLRVLIPLAALRLLWARPRRVNEQPEDKAPLHEWVAVLAVCCMSGVVWMFARIGTHYFFPRYAYVAAIGPALLLVMLCSRVPARRLVFPALALSAVWTFAGAMFNRVRSLPTPDPAQSRLVAQAQPGEPIVVASSLDFPVVWRYSDAANRSRLHFIADTAQAVENADFLPEICLLDEGERGVLPYRIDTLTGFLPGESHFYVIERLPEGGTPSEWLPGYLHQHGYRFATVGRNEGYEISEVTAPATNR